MKESEITLTEEMTEMTENSKNKRAKTRSKPKAAIIILSLLLILSFSINATLGFMLSEYENRTQHVESELATLQQQIANSKEGIYQFFWDNVACLNTNFTYYHHPNCPYWDKEHYTLYDTKWAEMKGYKPCPHCWK